VRDDWYNNEYVPRYRHGGDDMTMITGMVGVTTRGDGHGDKHADKDK
jgi:hypothetical protein